MGESTGRQWVPLAKSESYGALMLALVLVWDNCYTNSQKTGDLGRYDDNTTTFIDACKDLS